MGRAADFAGTYDLRTRDLHLIAELRQSDPRLAALGDEVDLIRAALPEFDRDAFSAGHLTQSRRTGCARRGMKRRRCSVPCPTML